MIERALLNVELPDVAKKMVVQRLMNLFADTFDVEAPCIKHVPYERGLWAFREFSAVCIEEALADAAYARAKAAELERNALDLGSKLRAIVRPADDALVDFVSWGYRIIGIEVTGSIPGELVFSRCYFAERYVPAVCALMSAFDSGMVCGFSGCDRLMFSTRITQGCDLCRAAVQPV